MGWSIDIIREELEAMPALTQGGRGFTLEHPGSEGLNRVVLTTEIDLPIGTKRAILAKFPEFVHVAFLVAKVLEHPGEQLSANSDQ